MLQFDYLKVVKNAVNWCSHFIAKLTTKVDNDVGLDWNFTLWTSDVNGLKESPAVKSAEKWTDVQGCPFQFPTQMV